MGRFWLTVAGLLLGTSSLGYTVHHFAPTEAFNCLSFDQNLLHINGSRHQRNFYPPQQRHASLDETHILQTDTKTQGDEIALYDLTTSERQVLHEGASLFGGWRNVEWSSDGNYVAYAWANVADEHYITIADREGRSLLELPVTEAQESISWQLNDRYVLLFSEANFILIEWATREAHHYPFAPPASDLNTFQITEQYLQYATRNKLYRIDLKSHSATQTAIPPLANGYEGVWAAHWSPDGQELLMVINTGNGYNELWHYQLQEQQFILGKTWQLTRTLMEVHWADKQVWLLTTDADGNYSPSELYQLTLPAGQLVRKFDKVRIFFPLGNYFVINELSHIAPPPPTTKLVLLNCQTGEQNPFALQLQENDLIALGEADSYFYFFDYLSEEVTNLYQVAVHSGEMTLTGVIPHYAQRAVQWAERGDFWVLPWINVAQTVWVERATGQVFHLPATLDPTWSIAEFYQLAGREDWILILLDGQNSHLYTYLPRQQTARHLFTVPKKYQTVYAALSPDQRWLGLELRPVFDDNTGDLWAIEWENPAAQPRFLGEFLFASNLYWTRCNY